MLLRRLASLPLLVAFLLPAPSAASTLNLTLVARLPAATDELAFGDSDHDGYSEVFLAWRDANYNFSYRIFEERGDNHFTAEYQGVPLHPYAVGDLDGDGKSDLVGQWDGLEVFESVSPSTYPTQLVWSYPVSPYFVPTAIADTDRDGKMEIIYFMRTGAYSTQLMIFEAAGDNTYNLVYVLPTHDVGTPVIGDFDGDGLTEIAFCGYKSKIRACELTVVEAKADNFWAVTFEDSTGLTNGGAGQGGRDTDGDGKPELFFAGLVSTVDGGDRAADIYEPCGDDCFQRIAHLQFNDGSTGITRAGLGNLDGVGPEEYFLESRKVIKIFRPVAPSQWTLVGELDDPLPYVHVASRLYDLNGNGRPELIWPTSASDAESTLVYEQVDLPTSTTVEVLFPQSALQIAPNPCGTSAILAAPGVPRAAAWVSVYDAAGRLVERTMPRQVANGRYLWTPSGSTSGVYYLRLEDAARKPLVSGRVTVVR